jgi:hypothetical protein
MVESNE